MNPNSAFNLTARHQSFPSARFLTPDTPIEVTVLAQLGLGAGDHLIAATGARMQHHAQYQDALDEPSTRLSDMHPEAGDFSAIHAFSVAAKGHPFHRHAGRRAFVAVSGSGGLELRFSLASSEQLASDPSSLVRHMRIIQVPPDCWILVRFGRSIWHQFVSSGERHPALFAVSYHGNEADGSLSVQAQNKVADNAASVADLTELLPTQVQQWLAENDWQSLPMARRQLLLHTPWQSTLAQCARLRSYLGSLRSRFVKICVPHAYLRDNGGGREVKECALPPQSLLHQWPEAAAKHVHRDSFALKLSGAEVQNGSATELLSRVLQGFIDQPPLGVSRLMAIRNILVKPLRLRTSTLGCPVSSLLQANAEQHFEQFPVLAQQHQGDGQYSEVMLGADDRHLQFRSVVAVEKCPDGSAQVFLSTHVHPKNGFGRLYMALIERTHRRYIAPSMLRLAVDSAQNQRHLTQGSEPRPWLRTCAPRR